MFNKKIILILTIILVSLFAVSAVNAADNATNDVVSVNDDVDKIISIEDTDVKLDEINSFNEVEVLSSQENDNVMSLKTDDDILSMSPGYSDYSVSVPDMALYYGVSGTIPITISPASKNYANSYIYDFYLKVYDSNNNLKIDKNYYGYSYTTKITHYIGAKELLVGNYTIKIVNYKDNMVMDTAKLTIKSSHPSYSDYSVSVSDTSIINGSEGTILMSISPPSSYFKYGYYFYLKVYDSNNNLKINQSYCANSFTTLTYYIGANELSVGNYTIKIVNYGDDMVMDTAKLTVKSLPTYPSYSDYSVTVSDSNLYYGYEGSISMSISPVSSNFKYKYDFYLKVYDSNNNVEIFKQYSSTRSDYYKVCLIGANQLSVGTYTIKIINYYDGEVMDTAKLTVNKMDTRIIANNINMNYGSNKNIIVTLKDSRGNLISDESLFIKLNGKTYYGVTNDNGQASIKVPKLVPKTYKVSIKFAGDNNYVGSSKSVTVVVKPITKITVKNMVGYEGKKIKLTAIVKDGLGKKIKKGTVKFKVKGKTYKASVKNGKATVTIKVPVAKKYKTVTKSSGNKRTEITYYKSVYNCKATFSGNKQYPSSSTKFKLTSKYKPWYYSYYVSKKKSSSSSSSSNGPSGKVDIILRQDYYDFWFNYNGNTLGNMPVTYKIYTGSTYDEYSSQTDSLGFVTIYNIPKGTHKIYIKGHYLLSSKSYSSTFTVYRG